MSDASTVVVTKQSLLQLINGAAGGDQQKIQQLVAPFITSDERLLWCGVTAKLGLLPTYDFAFITDRRVGDLEVTPFTGSLNVEACYLQHIDYCVIKQPAMPLWMWMLRLSMYVLFPMMIGVVYRLITMPLWYLSRESELVYAISSVIPWFVLSLAIYVASLAAVPLIVNPIIVRIYLRLKKSGIWLKLRGSRLGLLIFSDRHKFGTLTSVCRLVADQKRILDAEMA